MQATRRIEDDGLSFGRYKCIATERMHLPNHHVSGASRVADIDGIEKNAAAVVERF